MAKRLVVILLCLCLALGMFALPVAAGEQDGAVVNPFTDVKETDWYYSSVMYVYENEYFKGTSDTTFEPNESMTRGMFVTVLGRIAGVDENAYKGKDITFTDVEAGQYYAPYVAWGVECKIVAGYEDGTFRPDKKCTREEMAALFVRYFDAYQINYDTGANITEMPADYDSISAWAKDDVMKFWKQGLIVGYQNHFAPLDYSTRGQVASMCQRMDSLISADKCAVSFYDGETLIDTLYTKKNKPLNALPDVEKSSKANAVLIGYFTDAACTVPFYAADPVTGDMKVYAKYQVLESAEKLNLTTFTQVDQTPNLSFVVAPADGSATVEEALAALKLVPVGTSEPVKLEVKDNGNGTFTVFAPAGFEEGGNYELQLADGWNFDGKSDTIRTASFGIAKDDVANLKTSDKIKYIPNSTELTYDISKDNPKDGLLEPDRIVTENDAKSLTNDMIDDPSVVGSFDLSALPEANRNLNPGDIICIYDGEHPDKRIKTDANGTPYVDGDSMDSAVYVKVDHITDTTVNFVPLGEEDQYKLFHLPVNVPFKLTVEELAALGNGGTVDLGKMDTGIYAKEMDLTASEATAYVKDNMILGDFVTFFACDEFGDVMTDKLYHGRITAINGDIVTYEKCSAEDIETSMDMYVSVRLTGDDLVTPEEEKLMEAQLYAEVEASGFAEEAAYMVADLVTKTDNFKEDVTIQSLLLADEDGNALTSGDVSLSNLGKTFKLTDDIKLTVEIVKDGDQIHFTDSGSVQLAIGVEAGFEVESKADDGKLVIDLNAVFVEEVAIDPLFRVQLYSSEVLKCPYALEVGGIVDIRNYTAFSFSADIYTVEEEDKSLWEQMKGLLDDPIAVLSDVVPDKYKDDLKTFDDVMDEINKLNDNIEKMKSTYQETQETIEQYQGYIEDVEMLWDVLEDNNLTTKEDWAEMCDALDQTSITSDLLDMMELTNETGLSTEYYQSLEELLQRYQEVVTKKTGWITLCEYQILDKEVMVSGLAIGLQATFHVRADMSLSLGSNMEYEVGKRFDFWCKVGLCKWASGSTSMDILDEKFAFQFFVMGRLGINAGVDAKLTFGFCSGKLANVGVNVDFGPYIKFYGFFVYENEKFRAANTSEWHCDERMAGAFYMDFGMVFKFGLSAEIITIFETSKDLLDEEYSLVTAGEQRFYYQPLYQPAPDEVILVPSDNKGLSMEPYLSIKYMDLVTGDMGTEVLDADRFNISFSNPAFYIDKNGRLRVKVPADGVRYLEGELTITYKYGKMAFCDYDMSVTLPLVWTTLTDMELKEYYTASVSVNNMNGGADIIWSKNVLKGSVFDLPSADEIHKLMNWNDYKYDMGAGYGSQQLTGLHIIDHTNYPYLVNYDTYTLTVKDVVDADGNKSDKTFTARYGETFDLSALETTGTNIKGKSYLQYAGVTTDYTYDIPNANGTAVKGTIDLSQPVDDRMVEALQNGMTATAVYSDESVKATFEFVGIEAEPVEMILRRGDMPDLSAVNAVVEESHYLLKEITPILGGVYANTTYKVICERPAEMKKATLAFEENGGSEVADLELYEGAVLGALPAPTREHYIFDGWYSDAALTAKFEATTMPQGGATAYAKWIAETYIVTLNVNGGKTMENNTLTVTYGKPYGELPKPEFNGTTHGFAGWFTEAENGEQVTAESALAVNGDHTLYAHWNEKIEIPYDAPQINALFTTQWTGEPQDYIKYVQECYGEEYAVHYGWGYQDKGYPDVKSYEIRYRNHDTGEEFSNGACPVEIGTYDIIVYREADDQFQKYERVYQNYMKITLAKRPWTKSTYPTFDVDTENMGYTYVDVKLADSIVGDDGVAIANGGLGEMPADTELVYRLTSKNTGMVYSSKPVKAGEFARIDGFIPSGKYYGYSTDNSKLTNGYYLTVTVLGGEHYEDWTSPSKHKTFNAKELPETDWNDYALENMWYYDNPNATTFVIDTASELASFAVLVNGGHDNFKGDTVLLGADIDLSAHQWLDPIGEVRNNDYSTVFLGTFDGQGHTIKGLTSTLDYQDKRGLFGIITGNSKTDITIKNVVLEDAYIWGYNAVGGILGCGMLENIHIENCTVKGTILASHNHGTDYESSNVWVGGITGLYYGSVDGCSFYGAVGGKNYLGGIVGDYECEKGGSVTNCTNYGLIYNLVPGGAKENLNGICGSVRYPDNVIVKDNNDYGTILFQ
ncbi:MAG: S-layer homology domain-containing protein [Firmicutes bacterium]|nr:S-layer homology domain-containing protein [Bacillota bacterium]